jgi:hypothetical protein
MQLNPILFSLFLLISSIPTCIKLTNADFTNPQTVSDCNAICNCAFIDVSSSTDGGALFINISFDSISIVVSTFLRCHSNSSGGAIYGLCSLEIENCFFQTCIATNGHAIFHAPTTSSFVDSSDSTFFDCGRVDSSSRGTLYLNSTSQMGFSLLNFSVCRTLEAIGNDGSAIYLAGGNTFETRVSENGLGRVRKGLSEFLQRMRCKPCDLKPIEAFHACRKHTLLLCLGKRIRERGRTLAQPPRDFGAILAIR